MAQVSSKVGSVMVMLLLDSSRVVFTQEYFNTSTVSHYVTLVLLVSISMDFRTIHTLSEIISITPSFRYYYEGEHI